MFWKHGKHSIIIVVCFFFWFYESKQVSGIFSKSKDTKWYEEFYKRTRRNKNKEKWKKYPLQEKENRNIQTLNYKESKRTCAFINNYNNGHTFYLLNKNRRKFCVFKKEKQKGKQSNEIKKKEKRKFTEEEIEELRKKAKEKEQEKGKGKGKGKGKKGKKIKGVQEEELDEEEEQRRKEEEQKERKKEEERKEKEREKTLKERNEFYIKTREDFEKIVDLTKESINPKEVEYIEKISDCDEELLKYDKREKHIELNYEDTLFDEGNYMHNYINNISKFRFDIYNINNKNEFDRITKYLNYQYIQKINVDFPQDKSYNIKLKEYFYQVVCNLIDRYKEKFERVKIYPGEYSENDLEENPEEVKYESESESEKEWKNDVKDDVKDDVENDMNNNVMKGEGSSIQKNISLSYQPKSSTYIAENTKNNPIIRKFLNESQNIPSKGLSTIHRIENEGEIQSLLQQGQQQGNVKDATEKYMNADLFNLLCEIKEEYNYMFENGGLSSFSFDKSRKRNKEKLLFTGKKKRAFATVFLQPGNNNLIINNRDGYQYMQYHIFSINKIFSPLLHLCMHRYFNVVADVKGGGISGQSVAIFHALVKYIVYNLSLKIKPYFRSFKFMTVDSRKVERKKFGYRKARKKKQYSKR